MGLAKLVPELYCQDIRKSLDFYVSLLGFSILYDRPEEGFAYLDLDGAQIMLDEVDEDMTPPWRWWTGKPEKPYGRGINFQIEVSDVDYLYEVLISRKWPLFKPIEEAWYRREQKEVGQRQFLVQDPDGYLLRFCQSLGERSIDKSMF